MKVSNDENNSKEGGKTEVYMTTNDIPVSHSQVHSRSIHDGITMDFQQSNFTETQHNDEKKDMNKDDCISNISTNVARECASNVSRSQSSASMMIELSALPISDCGVQSEAVEQSNIEKSINQTNDIQNEAKCTSSIPTDSLPHSETNLRNNTSPQMNTNQSSLPIQESGNAPKNEKKELQAINCLSLDPKNAAKKLPQNDIATPSNHDADEKVFNRNPVALTIEKPSMDTNSEPISQSNHLLGNKNKAPLHHGTTNEFSSPSTNENLPNKTAAYAVTPNHTQSINNPPSSSQSPKPLKATKFTHLSAKYKNELQYMLVEFRKLERQLLSGYSGSKNGMENQGARARREKLHSFIIHLEDTAKQIEYGCQRQSQNESKEDNSTNNTLDDGSDRRKRRKIEEEDNVQRLEEHILANLIPVKARLVKQLAAQGRSQASIGGSTIKSAGDASSSRPVPIPRGYPQPQNQGPVAFIGKSTINDQKMGSVNLPSNGGGGRVTESQYGRTIGKNKGSSLTKKLYGQILGTKEIKANVEKEPLPLSSTLSYHSTTSDSMTNDELDDVDKSPAQKRKILYAGMAPGSDMKAKLSSVAAAAGTDQACAEIYDNYQASTSQVPETTKNPLSEITTRQTNESVQASSQPSPVFQTGKVENTIASNVNNQNQPRDVSCNFSAPKVNTTKQIKQYTNNSLIQQSPAARISPLTSMNTTSMNTTSLNTASLNIYNKGSLNNSAPNPLNARQGPATAAVEAAALSKTSSADKYRQPHSEKPMPPPAPLTAKNTTSQILGTGEISQSQTAKIERRKRRLERRRRRRKRRQARLHAINESFKSNGPMISTHHRNGNSISSTSQYYQSGSGNKSMAHGMKSTGGNNLTRGTYPKIRSVEYICAHCNEQYRSTCEYNPWWALTHEECPKCRKTQVPRIDITAPANTIEYHPALLAHAEEASSSNGSSTNGNTMNKSHQYGGKSSTLQATGTIGSANGNKIVNSDADFHPDDELNLDDDAESSDASTDEDPLEEDFGKAYKGPKLGDEEAAKILCLIEHASTCPGKHKSPAHGQVCNSVKYMMLHVRDCPGITTCSGEVCPFPWCRKIKHLLYHLVTCVDRETCQICRRSNMSPNNTNLVKLNRVRRKKLEAKAKQKVSDRSNIPTTGTPSHNVKRASGQINMKKVSNPPSNPMTNNPLSNDPTNVRGQSISNNGITTQGANLQSLISKSNIDPNRVRISNHTVMTRPLISKKAVIAQTNPSQPQSTQLMSLPKLSPAPIVDNVSSNQIQKVGSISNPVYSHINLDTTKSTSVRNTVPNSNQTQTIYNNSNGINASNLQMNNLSGNNVMTDTKLNSRQPTRHAQTTTPGSQPTRHAQTTISSSHTPNSNIQPTVEQKLLLGGNEKSQNVNDAKTKLSEAMPNILMSSSNVLQNTDVGDVTNSSSCIVNNPLKASGTENIEFGNPNNVVKSNLPVVTHYVQQQKMLFNQPTNHVNATDKVYPDPKTTHSNVDVSMVVDSQSKSSELHEDNELAMFSSEFMRQYPSTNNLNGVTMLNENSTGAQNFENNHMRNEKHTQQQQPLSQSSSAPLPSQSMNENRKDEVSNTTLKGTFSNISNGNTEIPSPNISNANTNMPLSTVPNVNKVVTSSNISMNHNNKSIVVSTCISSTAQNQVPVSTMQNSSSLPVSATVAPPILSVTTTEGDGQPQIAVGCPNDTSKENNQLQVSC